MQFPISYFGSPITPRFGKSPDSVPKTKKLGTAALQCAQQMKLKTDMPNLLKSFAGVDTKHLPIRCQPHKDMAKN